MHANVLGSLPVKAFGVTVAIVTGTVLGVFLALSFVFTVFEMLG